MLAQPVQEVHDLAVAPHPAREAREVAERGGGVGVVVGAAGPAAGAVGVGPVGLDGHRVKAPLLDQPLRDVGAGGVELVGAVRGLAEQHAAGVADAVDEGVEVGGGAGQLMRARADRSGVGGAAHRGAGTPGGAASWGQRVTRVPPLNRRLE